MFLAAPLTFAMLQQRLLDAARSRVSNGDFTERGLARLIGISQPHVHHILKGQRILTPEVGDALLVALDLSLFDLLSDDEMGQALLDRRPAAGAGQHIPILSGRLGPHDAFPDWRAVARWVRPSSETWRRGRRPALVEYGPDAELPAPCCGGAFALIEQDESARMHPAPPCWYVLRWRGCGYIRQVRRENDSLQILSQLAFEPSPLPAHIELSEVSLLAVVRARLLWWGANPVEAGDLIQSAGEWLPAPAASS